MPPKGFLFKKEHSCAQLFFFLLFRRRCPPDSVCIYLFQPLPLRHTFDKIASMGFSGCDGICVCFLMVETLNLLADFAINVQSV